MPSQLNNVAKQPVEISLQESIDKQYNAITNWQRCVTAVFQLCLIEVQVLTRILGNVANRGFHLSSIRSWAIEWGIQRTIGNWKCGGLELQNHQIKSIFCHVISWHCQLCMTCQDLPWIADGCSSKWKMQIWWTMHADDCAANQGPPQMKCSAQGFQARTWHGRMVCLTLLMPNMGNDWCKFQMSTSRANQRQIKC